MEENRLFKTTTQQKAVSDYKNTNMYNNRQFMIFDVSELPNVDFTQVLETSEETVRKSVDGTKTFVKWEGETVPPSVESLSTKQGPYTYEEMLSILSGIDWTNTEISQQS